MVWGRDHTAAIGQQRANSRWFASGWWCIIHYHTSAPIIFVCGWTNDQYPQQAYGHGLYTFIWNGLCLYCNGWGWIGRPTHGAIISTILQFTYDINIRLGVVWMQYINLYNWVLHNNQIVYRGDFYSGVVEVSILYHWEKAKEHLYDWWDILIEW